MSPTPQTDQRHFEREYDRIAGELIHYFDAIVATERLAIAGAASVVAFLYTDLPSFAAGQAKILAALPLAIVALAGLRCLSIFVVMMTGAAYLRKIEREMLSRPDLGVQRTYSIDKSPAIWLIVVTTTAFWMFATAVTAYFWWAYSPAVES
ncbi:hypothetical protein KHP62_02295 [Rhodobacteraceae bacterium NNCM2]|nr:hypothetical protein [Coraliihabitans acroporae]